MPPFADNSYIISSHKDKEIALEYLGRKLKKIIKWLKDSGLKVNESKTELCIFHRIENTDGNLLIDNVLINATNEINAICNTFGVLMYPVP